MAILARCVVCALFCVFSQNVGAIHSPSLNEKGDTVMNDGTTFVPEIPFTPGVTTPAELSALASILRKPAMAVVRTTGCPVCRDLVKNMNQHSASLAKFMSKVVSVDVGDNVDQSQWVANHSYAEGYVPRIYFMNSTGSFVDILAPRDDKYKYSFWTAKQLEEAISKVLVL
eukprot:TRINITY_DN61096_c0_g1_i1.p1 TRINITY_DN61096_c0_g1~~TRINITY_DN61096_c0_g1_i1.p1  ORF type:complete len:195 (+),score=23.93 TRINITY_DN61096_c0_g1_i1:75-587(+)